MSEANHDGRPGPRLDAAPEDSAPGVGEVSKLGADREDTDSLAVHARSEAQRPSDDNGKVAATSFAMPALPSCSEDDGRACVRIRLLACEKKFGKPSLASLCATKLDLARKFVHDVSDEFALDSFCACKGLPPMSEDGGVVTSSSPPVWKFENGRKGRHAGTRNGRCRRGG